MKWGLERADRMGLPSYIEATDMGKPVYERFGFTAIKANELSLDTRGDREREEMAAKCLPVQWWSMLREPVQELA